MTPKRAKRGFLFGYFLGIESKEAKDRYLDKIKIMDNRDLFEISKDEWHDDVDFWPKVTYINVGMYLLFSSSPYTED